MIGHEMAVDNSKPGFSPIGDLFAPYAQYHPDGTSVSSLSGLAAFVKKGLRDKELAHPVRAQTLDWLVIAVCDASHRPVFDVRSRLLDAIPYGQESVLDADGEFIFVVIDAAMALGIDPNCVRLTPGRLDS